MADQNRNLRISRPYRTLLALLLCLLAAGCATDRYQYGTVARTKRSQPFVSNVQNPVAVGGHHPFVDRIETVVQAPRRFVRRILGWENPSEIQGAESRRQALELSQTYLMANGMDDVYIDVRRYEPAQQWDRIRNNDRIGPIWKYTGGTISWLTYTLIPKRALQADRYDVFANTLSINSAGRTGALYQAARAKEYQQHNWQGTYAMLHYAPLVPLYHHGRTTSDVLSYGRHSGQHDQVLDELYSTAYSQLASATVSEALFFSPLPADTPFIVEPAVRIVGRAIGGVAGRIALRQERGTGSVSQASYTETQD